MDGVAHADLVSFTVFNVVLNGVCIDGGEVIDAWIT